MPAIWWPRKLSAENTYAVRTGRVLHIAGLVLGVFFIGAAFLRNEPIDSWGLFIVGVAALVAGRGMRYILADE